MGCCGPGVWAQARWGYLGGLDRALLASCVAHPVPGLSLAGSPAEKSLLGCRCAAPPALTPPPPLGQSCPSHEAGLTRRWGTGCPVPPPSMTPAQGWSLSKGRGGCSAPPHPRSPQGAGKRARETEAQPGATRGKLRHGTGPGKGSRGRAWGRARGVEAGRGAGCSWPRRAGCWQCPSGSPGRAGPGTGAASELIFTQAGGLWPPRREMPRQGQGPRTRRSRRGQPAP